MSDTIAGEVMVTDLVYPCSLLKSPAEWADFAVDTIVYHRDDSSLDKVRTKFDVIEQAEKMTLFYETGNAEVLI